MPAVQEDENYSGPSIRNPAAPISTRWAARNRICASTLSMQEDWATGVRLDGSDRHLFVPRSAAWPDVSPNGKYILSHAVSAALQAKISVVHFPEGTPVDFQAEGLRARFSADGRSIVYIRNGGRDIVRQDFLLDPVLRSVFLYPRPPTSSPTASE
jgi:hypothetical protein